MELTPAQRQYKEIKNSYKDCIVFFRMGDFYETFYEDAKICSKVLDIVLTSRSKDNSIPMAGIPYHSSEKYIYKLIKAGYKVAIAEQISTPKPGEIVQRKVTNIVTPGTYLEDNFSPSILSIVQDQDLNLAWGDVSSGNFFTKKIDIETLPKILSVLRPNEIILDIDSAKGDLKNYIKNFSNGLITIVDIPLDEEFFLEKILGYKPNSKAFGGKLKSSLALVLNYILKNKQKTFVNSVSYQSGEKELMIDENTIRNLEIFSSSYGEKKYSLFGVINNCGPNGSKILKNILSSPVQDLDLINPRLDKIDYFQNFSQAHYLKNLFDGLGDIEKLLGMIFYKSPNYVLLLRLKNILLNLKDKTLNECSKDIGYNFESIVDKCLSILSSLSESGNDIDFINSGVDPRLDELREIYFHSDRLLLQYQKQISESTKLSFKIKYIQNQGYFLELTKKDSDIFEANNFQNMDFFRAQSLKGAQRYTSTYLQQLQEKIFSAKNDFQILENEILEKIYNQILNYSKHLSQLANDIGHIDLFVSYAIFAKENNFVRPSFGDVFEIIAARHPIVEKFLPLETSFVENDLTMNNTSLHLITGPNMGGKSTYLRQNAIVVFLAHCGLFVPAKKVSLNLVDGIFARVGSGDNLAKNQSTFMTEMSEVANIIHLASEKSFIILDEIGRGTSTYDGLALARAIIIYLLEKKSKTLVATHYHELLELENEFGGFKNFSLGVYETSNQIVFLKKIVSGGASRSYGLEVAKLAGLPKSILNEAKNYLSKLDKNVSKSNGLFESEFFIENTNDKAQQLLNSLQNIDLNNITPIEALNELHKLKNML